MNEPCKDFQGDLSLYAEGEMDPLRAERIRLHLSLCPECRSELEDYIAFTREILAAEKTASSGSSGSEAEAPPARAPAENAFVDRVMAEVRSLDARRRMFRWARLAAALIAMAGIALVGAVYLGIRLFQEQPSRDLADSSSAIGLSGRGSESTDRLAAPGLPAGLESAWWVIDPEGEREADAGRRIETVLYSRTQPHSPEASLEDLEILLLKALLDAREAPGSFASGADLLVVPEGAGAEKAIPLRPVAMPVRVPGREIAESTRWRIQSPARRYRIIWVGQSRLPVLIPPVFTPRGDGAPFGSRFDLEPRERPLPLKVEQY